MKVLEMGKPSSLENCVAWVMVASRPGLTVQRHCPDTEFMGAVTRAVVDRVKLL